MTHFLVKYRWALLGTFLLHLGLMIYMKQVKVRAPYQPLGELTEIPMQLEEIPIAEPPKPEDITPQPENGKVSNITANERDKIGQSDKRYDSRSFKNLDQDVEKELRDFEKSAFNEEAGNRKTDVVINEPDKNISKNKSKDNGENANDASHVRSAGRVAGSYDLGGRKDEVFSKPAYVCKGSGTIVLKVEVNRNGKVTDAQIDPLKSKYTEECMGENAVRYAKKCKFEAGTQWPDPQKGTITYTYISQ